MDYIANLTPEIAYEMLHAAGLCCSPDEIQIVAREERWVVALPGDRLAWFAASKSGSRRLAAERRVNGIFDYDGAAWADRHHDFRYLLFDVSREDMLDAALAVYEPATGRKLDRGRIRLYHAACAISYLAFRSGTRPEQKSCGRTLAEDLRWVRIALSKIA